MSNESQRGCDRCGGLNGRSLVSTVQGAVYLCVGCRGLYFDRQLKLTRDFMHHESYPMFSFGVGYRDGTPDYYHIMKRDDDTGVSYQYYCDIGSGPDAFERAKLIVAALNDKFDKANTKHEAA